MNECEHERRFPLSEQIKRVGGREFRYLAETCESCGAVLWNQKAEVDFREWMRTNREKFMLQFSVPQGVAKGIQEILHRYPGTSDSHFVRAVLSVFTNHVFASPEISQHVTAVRESNAYKVLAADEVREKMKVRINPNLLEVVETWAALVGMSVPKFVEECLTQVVALFGTRGSSSVWSEELDRQLDLVMKAA
jgi:hypothetical protein